MKFVKYFFIFLFFLQLIFSCSSKKNIIYIQDINQNKIEKISYVDYKIKVDDILKIDVMTQLEESAIQFNPKGLNASMSNSKDVLLYNGYQVSSTGNINFPALGKIKVEGLTRVEIEDMIHSLISDKEILTDHTVDVKILNTHFTILGEVQNPGRFEYLSNNLNILEAIGMAGDLTINGKRKDVKLIRGEKVISLDLTKSDFMNNDYFQIISGDIIIINPNLTQVKRAGIIGNSGTLLSLLSFILSSIIVINSN